ncbi:SIMPL domain-containing protein [Ferruginibacter sp.]|nr:SIMPL domain-containing protein [Ferruginibacter sp.]
MKQLIALFVILLSVFFAKAQTQPACNPYPKTISVTGSAEMEIVPDEIYVQIDLKEYKKKGENKVELDKIKSDFLAKCSSIGLVDSVISIASYQGANYNYWYWQRRKKDPDMYAGIAYQIKFKDSKKMDQLVDLLDDEATANFQITKATHSKIQDYRKQLKIQAVKAAKDKGIYLTDAINEKLGEAITIEEPDENTFVNNLENNIRVSQFNSFNYNKDAAKMNDNGVTGVDFKKIKLCYEVIMIFAVK